MFSAERPHFRRAGAAIIAAILATMCAMAQENAPRRTTDSAANAGGATLPSTAAPAVSTRKAAPAANLPQGTAKKGIHPERDSSVELTPQVGHLIRLRDKDGQPVWTIYGATVEQFIDFLKSKNTPDSNEPDYSISSVSITGNCDDEKAQLTAKIEIQVDRDGAWLSVPIGLQGGILIPPGIRQTGAGECRAAQSSDVTMVYVRGKGLHELFVPLLVPIRRQLNQRHLQLSFPPAAGSQITLRVSKERCQVKPIEGSHVIASPVPQGTKIEAYGIKGQLDLSWDVPLNEPQARPVFDVASKWTFGMEGDRLRLHVVQTIDPKQGTVGSIRVHMPGGFATATCEQKDVTDPRKYTASDGDAAGFIKIDLKPTASGRAELNWELEGSHAAGAPIVLRGLDVEGARSESGEIGLIPSEGFRFEVRGGDNVRRINGLGAGLAESAYSFSQPFRMELGVEEIRPEFSVDPSLFLLLSEQRAELSGQFHFQIRQGALRTVAFKWTDWKKQGWKIDEFSENAELVEIDPKDQAAKNTLRFRLSGRLGADFVVSFRAVRSIPAKEKAFRLTLPVVEAPVRPANSLVVADA